MNIIRLILKHSGSIFSYLKTVLTNFYYEYLRPFLSWLNDILDSTGHKKKILFVFSSVILLIISNSLFKEQIQGLNYDFKLWRVEVQNKKMLEEKDQEKIEFQEFLEEELFSKTDEYFKLKQEQCLQQIEFDFLLNNRLHSNQLPTKTEIEIVRENALLDSCSFEKMNEEIYEYMLKQPFEKKFLEHLEKRRLQAEKIQKEISEKNKVILDNKGNPNARLNNSENLKAVFCAWGHGGRNENGIYDRGASSKGHKFEGYSERDLNLPIMKEACAKIKNHFEPKGVIVYELGYEEDGMYRFEKQDFVNKVSEENGYNYENALYLELHFDSAGNPKSSGVHFLYSKAGGKYQAYDFAERIMYEVRKFHNTGDRYKIAPTGMNLAVLDGTPVLSLIMEGGFLTNEQDTKMLIENKSKFADAIADGIIGFAG